MKNYLATLHMYGNMSLVKNKKNTNTVVAGVPHLVDETGQTYTLEDIGDMETYMCESNERITELEEYIDRLESAAWKLNEVRKTRFTKPFALDRAIEKHAKARIELARARDEENRAEAEQKATERRIQAVVDGWDACSRRETKAAVESVIDEALGDK